MADDPAIPIEPYGIGGDEGAIAQFERPELVIGRHLGRVAEPDPILPVAVRDLACAGLVSVTGNKFAITESGRAISKAAWAEYDAKPRGNFLGDKLAKRLKKIPCCADVGGWSVTQQDYDAAVAAYRAYFHEASKKADVMLAAWREEQAQHPESVKQGKVRDVVIITLKLFAYLGIGLVAAALLFFVITALGGYR